MSLVHFHSDFGVAFPCSINFVSSRQEGSLFALSQTPVRYRKAKGGIHHGDVIWCRVFVHARTHLGVGCRCNLKDMWG